jgi:uncharacterized protein YdhG (YjbR/CyaY superfamily)
MVQSKALTVDAYLAEAAPPRRVYLQLVREVARRVLADHEERMHWGMPVYVRQEKIRFAFAEQKQFVSLYVMDPKVLDENAEAIAGMVRGKRCLRFRRLDRIDARLLEQLLQDARQRP